MSRNQSNRQQRRAQNGSSSGNTPAAPASDRRRRSNFRSLLPLIVGAIAYTLSLPPFHLWPLAFVALTGLLLVTRSRDQASVLRWVWIIGVIHWGVTFQFLRLPHWTGYLGVLLMASYTALYDVAFVWLVRRLSVRHWPLVVSAPLAWAGLEVVRSTILSGIPIGILAHGLYRQPALIQTADLAGELTVSAVLAVSSAMFATLIAWLAPGHPVVAPLPIKQIAVNLTLGCLVLVGHFAYGWMSFPRYQLPDDSESASFALIQGAQDVQFGLTAEESDQESEQSYTAHRRMTVEARQQQPDLDVAVWAESMFPAIDILPLDDQVFQWDDRQWQERDLNPRSLLQRQQLLPYQVMDATGTGDATQFPFRQSLPMIVGMRSYDVLGDRDFNAAVQFDRYGQVQNRYSKTHLVPFGEYLPLGEQFPQLYQLAPIPRGLSVGQGATTFAVGPVRVIPTICYESVIGWRVRGYINDLRASNRAPNGSNEAENSEGGAAEPSARPVFDALLNISNDGWFWGSSALDLHLASNVFRAVENRSQHLVVSNTGISANISPDGTILQEAPKRTLQWLIATVPKRPQWVPTWWVLGNWPWWAALALVIVGSLIPAPAVAGLGTHRPEAATPAEPDHE